MNLLRYEKGKNIEDNIIKDVRFLFRLKKENEATKDKISEILEIFLN